MMVLYLSLNSWMKIFMGILFVGGILMLICYLCGVSSVTFGFNFFLFLPLFYLIQSDQSLVVGVEETLLSPPLTFLLILVLFILFSLSFISFYKPLRGL